MITGRETFFVICYKEAGKLWYCRVYGDGVNSYSLPHQATCFKTQEGAWEAMDEIGTGDLSVRFVDLKYQVFDSIQSRKSQLVEEEDDS